MRSIRTRHSVAFLCIVLVLFATMALSVSPREVTAILADLGLVLPAVAVVVLRRLATRCDAQPVSLLSLASFRAPPASLVLA